MSTPNTIHSIHGTDKFAVIDLDDKLPRPAHAKFPFHRTDSEFPFRQTEDTEKQAPKDKNADGPGFWAIIKKDTFIHVTTRLFLFFVNTFLVTLLVMTQMYDPESPMTSPVKWLYYSTLVLSGYTILNGLVYVCLRSAWQIMARFWIFLEFGWALVTTFSVACAGMFLSSEAKQRDEAYVLEHPNANVMAIGILILAVFQLVLCLYALCLTCINYEQYKKTQIMEIPTYCGGPHPNHPYGPWAQQPTILSRQDQTASPLPIAEPVAVKFEEKDQPSVTVRSIHSDELSDTESRRSSVYSAEYEEETVVNESQHRDERNFNAASSGKMSFAGPQNESASLEDLRGTAGGAFIGSTTNMSRTTLSTMVKRQ